MADLRVLVVDDSAELCDLICMVIDSQPDWRVVARAGDGSEAVDQAAAAQPDLVLLDVAMPVMDGMQALPLIRQRAPEATVVMLSGYPFATAGQGCLNAGAHGYIEKADLVRDLVPQIQASLDQVDRG